MVFGQKMKNLAYIVPPSHRWGRAQGEGIGGAGLEQQQSAQCGLRHLGHGDQEPLPRRLRGNGERNNNADVILIYKCTYATVKPIL